MGLEWVALFGFSFLKGFYMLFGYINNNAFPQPLSEKDEAEYLRRYQLGDEDARHVLIEHNLRLVAHITKTL